MNSWNPFGKLDMEIGSFMKNSVFNKDYESDKTKANEKSKETEDKDFEKQ
jgi:hypothetical protein